MSGFLDRLSEMTASATTWPSRLGRWLFSGFWRLLAFIRDLPRLSKEATIALALAFKNLALAVGRFSRDGLYLLIFQTGTLFERLTRPLVENFTPDPASIPPGSLTISHRGRKVALFCRQLSSMSQGGIPLAQCLDALAAQADDPKLAHVSKALAAKLAEGHTMSKAVSAYAKIFPVSFAHLLRAGETTGRLVEVLGRTADLMEREERLIKEVKGALTYPIFVMVITLLLTIGLFTTVLPGFADFYQDFEIPLPLVTATIMKLTMWMQSPWFWLTSILCAFSAVKLTKYYWAKPQSRLTMFEMLLTIPMAGPIIKFSTLARYCWILELTQDSGLDIVRSLKLSSLASGSTTLEADFNRISRGITEGEFLSDLMRVRPNVYPHLLQQMVLMGEESSQSSEAFGRAGGWFEQEVQGRVETFQAALEPILMGGISTAVGTVVLAVFLPLYGLLDKLGV